MAPEVKNNESADSKIKEMLADNKLTKDERQKIIEMLDSKKEETKQEIKAETLSSLRDFLNKTQGGDDFKNFRQVILPIIEERLGENNKNKGLTESEIMADLQKEIDKERRKDMERMKPDKFISDKGYENNRKKLNKKPTEKVVEVKQEDIVDGALTKEEFKRLSRVDFSKKSTPEIREIKRFLIEKLEKLTGISYAGKREEKRVESLDFIAKILQKSELQKVSVPGFAFTEKNLPLKPNKKYPLAFEGLSSSVRDVTLIRKDVTGITSVYQGSTMGSGVDREPYGLGTEIWAYGDKYIGGYKDGEYSGRGVLISGKEKFDGFFNRGAPAGEMKVTLANGDTVKGNMNSFDVNYGVWEGIRINKNGELIGLWKENKYRVATEQDKKEYKKQKQI